MGGCYKTPTVPREVVIMSVTVQPVPIFTDNYAWLLRETTTGAVAIVDPADAAGVAPALEAAADAHRLPKLDIAVREGDLVKFGAAEARVIEVPGHTRGHIAYFFADGAVLLSGDTLFSVGCGKLLEGTAAEMFASLKKFSALPDHTLIACGHEYTESNVRFALTIEPENIALHTRALEVMQL